MLMGQLSAARETRRRQKLGNLPFPAPIVPRLAGAGPEQSAYGWVGGDPPQAPPAPTKIAGETLCHVLAAITSTPSLLQQWNQQAGSI